MIHRVRIPNFKSIIDVTVDLSPVTVLVGMSGTGKSNFVHALRFFRDILSANFQQFGKFQQSRDRLRSAVSPEAPTRVEIEFSVAGIEEQFRYVLSLGATVQLPVIEESLELGSRCLLRQVQGEWIGGPNLFEVPQPGVISLGRVPTVTEIRIAFAALTLGIGCYAFSDKVLCDGKKDHHTVGLDDEGTNFLDAQKGIVSNLRDLTVRKSIVGVLQRVNPSVSSVELNDLQQPSFIVVGHRINGKVLPLQLSQESDGFRRFYAHLLALYQQPPKQTLIFEHPEDGIHPGALGLLADEFKAAAENGRGQVILTTHSPKLLDHFDADQIRVVEFDGFETRIGPVSNEQKEAMQDKLLDAGELLTVDPARMQKETAGV